MLSSPDSRALLADAQGTRELVARYAADLSQEEFMACLMAAGMLD